MAIDHVIHVAEAALFTAGCAVLRIRRLDPEQVGVLLVIVIAVLFFAVLIVATATDVIAVAPEPDELRSVFG